MPSAWEQTQARKSDKQNKANDDHHESDQQALPAEQNQDNVNDVQDAVQQSEDNTREPDNKPKEAGQPQKEEQAEGSEEKEEGKPNKLPASRLERIMQKRREQQEPQSASQPQPSSDINKLADILTERMQPASKVEEQDAPELPDPVLDIDGFYQHQNDYIKKQIEEGVKSQTQQMQEQMQELMLNNQLQSWRNRRQQIEQKDPQIADAIDYIDSVAAARLLESNPGATNDELRLALDYLQIQLAQTAEQLGFRNNVAGFLRLHAQEQGWSPEISGMISEADQVGKPQQKSTSLNERRFAKQRTKTFAGAPTRGAPPRDKELTQKDYLNLSPRERYGNTDMNEKIRKQIRKEWYSREA